MHSCSRGTNRACKLFRHENRHARLDQKEALMPAPSRVLAVFALLSFPFAFASNAQQPSSRSMDEYSRKVVAKVKALVLDTLHKWETAGFK